MTLGFDRDVSKILKEGSVADNVSWQADVKLTNSSVRRNRARSILISTQGKVLLENNSFSSCTGVSLLFEGDATFWYESGPVRNVVIRSNKFSDFGLEGTGGPIIQFTPRVSNTGNPTFYYHRNIVFENNDCSVFGAYFGRCKNRLKILFLKGIQFLQARFIQFRNQMILRLRLNFRKM